MAPESLVRKQAAGGGELDELAERSLAGEIPNRAASGAYRLRHGFAKRALIRRAKQHYRTAFGLLQAARRLGEPLAQPALGAAVGRAGADADRRRRNAEARESRHPFARCGVCPFQLNGGNRRDFIHDAGAPQQLQIIEPLMTRNFSARGTGMASVSSHPRPSRA